jgi:DNA-directed RNA polymerase subunit RPC12/RpoP
MTHGDGERVDLGGRAGGLQCQEGGHRFLGKVRSKERGYRQTVKRTDFS